MQMALAYGLMLFAIIYAIKAAKGKFVFKDLLLFMTFVWSVASVIYKPFIQVRNQIWLVLFVFSIFWIVRERRSIVVHIWPVTLFLAFMMFSSIWAINITDCAIRTLGTIMMFSFVVAQIWTREPSEAISKIYQAMVVTSIAIVIVLMLGAQQGISFSQRFQMLQYGFKATGLAEYAIVSFLVLLGAGLREKRNKKRLFVAAALFSLMIMVLTQTRGALFQLIGVLCFITLYENSPKLKFLKIAFPLLILVVLSIMYISPTTAMSFAQFYRLTPESGLYYDEETGLETNRTEIWNRALEKAYERPILGRGTGASNFTLIPDELVEKGFTTEDLQAATVHSQYVETFYDHGVLGLILLIFLLTWITKAAIRVYRQPPVSMEIETKFIVVLWTIVPIGMLTHGGYFSSGNIHRVWAWTFGIIIIYIDHVIRMYENRRYL